MLHGSNTALITPFKNGAVDEAAFAKLVDWQVVQGSHGLVPCGTTGESPTLSHSEHQRVVEICIEAVAGRVPVIAGAGSNSTAEAVAFTEHAAKAGADAVLHVTPYYNKPTQAGLIAHFEAISDASALPIVIYNIPGRSIVDMTPETMGVLAKRDNIIGVKDATADMARVGQQAAHCGAGFIQLSGEDESAVAFNQRGGRGCISVVSNIVPDLCAAMQNASLDGDIATAEALQAKLVPLIRALFSESSPSPIKYAMARLGHCAEDIRLPLLPATDATRAQVDAALADLGLI
ncbi:MAG: 4-hydroxy-tetrahydrodipicolinate synthase [Parvibaculales bacterium]|jgi:4-hydroxy-tetrahydrodipicolinate synthase